MPTDQEFKIPHELEMLMAQELAVALVAKHVGFTVEEFEVRWSGNSYGRSGDSSKSVALSSVSGIHLLTSGASSHRRSYIEKRIAVLCARAYASMLVMNRRATADGRASSGYEFWESLEENGDRSRAAELCAAYLTEDPDRPESDDPEGYFSDRQNQDIVRFGPRVLAEFLTDVEFLSLVDQSLRGFGCSTPSFRATISAGLLQDYKPGHSTLEIKGWQSPTEQECGISASLTSLRQRPSDDDDELSRHCLVAHELGHWLAARYVEIPTSGVKFRLQEFDGSCTVFLGYPAFHWPLERYLSARIAVLCAGSYADCWLRYPEKRVAIGGSFFDTMYRGTGWSDFSKLQEIYLLYRTVLQSIPRKPNLASSPSNNEVLTVLTSLLRSFGLYNSLRSPEFGALAKHMLCKAQLSSAASSDAPLQWIELGSEELVAACLEHGLPSENKETAAPIIAAS